MFSSLYRMQATLEQRSSMSDMGICSSFFILDMRLSMFRGIFKFFCIYGQAKKDLIVCKG